MYLLKKILQMNFVILVEETKLNLLNLNELVMTILKNILAVVLGLIIGGTVNMSIIMASGSIIPPPEGADITTMEGLKTTMHLFKPIHFLLIRNLLPMAILLAKRWMRFLVPTFLNRIN